eukprot:54229-Chlamydomonas_euryale.AAC.4
MNGFSPTAPTRPSPTVNGCAQGARKSFSGATRRARRIEARHRLYDCASAWHGALGRVQKLRRGLFCA